MTKIAKIIGHPMKGIGLALALSGCVGMGTRDMEVEPFDAAIIVTGVAILVGLASMTD